MGLFDRFGAYLRGQTIQDSVPPEPVPAELKPVENSVGSYIYFTVMPDGGISCTTPVSPDMARKLSTVYRCMNVVSDDIAGLPLQQFVKLERGSSRVKPDGNIRNTAYLIEIEPNRWQTPFLFKKGLVLDLLNTGNAYVWRPVQDYPELYKLNPKTVSPRLDSQGNRYFYVRFENGSELNIPDPEMLHLMINPDVKLMIGRSVLAYANETLNRQTNANTSRNKLQGNGLLPAAAITVAGDLNTEGREAVRRKYLDAAAGGVAVFDNKIANYQVMQMNATDAQFLESILATEREIANFFGVPEYKLNMGKQSYQSNEQQQLDYLATTLNPYLIQIEQTARLKWLAIEDQPDNFFRFERKALLQIDAKSQAEFLKAKIDSGTYSPNEARAIEDLEPYDGGDVHMIQGGMAIITPKGLILAKKDEENESEPKIPTRP